MIMASSSQEAIRENRNDDSYPLFMEQPENDERSDHVIDIDQRGYASSSSPVSFDTHSLGLNHNEESPSSIPRTTILHSPSSSSSSSSTIPSPHISAFNVGQLIVISIGLTFSLGKIIAAIVVLALSRHENPHTPLFTWVVGYAIGCVVWLPLLCWHCLQIIQNPDQQSITLRQDSSRSNSQCAPNSYIPISLTRSSDEEKDQNNFAPTQNLPNISVMNPRLKRFMNAFHWFYTVWFVVGNVWIFGGKSSAVDAPNLYRLCIAFLTFGFIWYAMPFILCALICCRCPYAVYFLGVGDDKNQKRGESEKSIITLPKHKFQLKRNESCSSRDSGSGVDDGGVIAVGTENERAISAEDAVCSICLARYTNKEELRDFPCSHFFHTDCVDKWLKINASCPLCKFEIVGSNKNSSSTVDPSPQI